MPEVAIAPSPDADPATPRPTDAPGDRSNAGSRFDSLARNGLAVMATTGVNASTGYLFWIVAAVALTVEDLGRASSAIAAVGLVTLLADLGLTTTIVADLPGRTDRHRFLALVFTAGLVASMLGAALATGVLIAFVDELQSMLDGPGTMAFAAAIIGMTLGRYCDQVSIADRRAHLMLVRNAGFALGKLALLGLVVLTATSSRTGGPLSVDPAAPEIPLVRDVDPGSVVVVWALAAVASVLVIGRRLDLGLGAPLTPSPDDRRLVVDSTVHHLANLGGEIPMFLLPILVLTRADAEAAGIFYVTWMVASIVFTVSAAMSASLLAEARHDPDALSALTRRTLGIIGVILVVGILGTVAFGSFVLGLFGDEFGEAGFALLVVLAFSAIPDGVTNVWVSRWRAADRHRRAAVLNVVMAVVAIGWAWVRVPIDGIVAVGWAWVVCQSTGCALIAVLEASDRLRGRRGHASPIDTSSSPTAPSSPTTGAS